ncbi:alpha/beta fold hydrolase [Hufsiella ginkgonis]|uniref:Proline iminopeptidase n=1 Tax=Hufsiella ginkgonis TaxID=2695274 RepID=A0A7K1Y0A7_9SPHI|nr:alpha/beta fold hydrolase [Hufsiella ginkgonis]MXV16508.1 alpha/beta fold hydrolase [Hufsiella ginkgonis]
MKRTSLFYFAILLLSGPHVFAQRYEPRIEEAKLIKTDPRLIVRSGYLVVPENRSDPRGRQTKVPFVFVRKPEQDPRKGVALYSTGGPGYSTVAGIDSIGFQSGYLKYGGFIAFDLRGTRLSQPCLTCPAIDPAIRESYVTGNSRDSLVRIAVNRCRNSLEAANVDLSAYNTIESAADINDLRSVLGLDSLYLVGISYSGGLMLTVARNHPGAVRALILNSPLPGFARYEEDALFNINQALDQVFANCSRDSSTRYSDLKTRFRRYFSAITEKTFKIRYRPGNAGDSLLVSYTKHELLEAVVNRMNTAQVKTVPLVILDILNGRHDRYVREVLDDYFRPHQDLSYGLRYSVYCTEQIAYARRSVMRRQQRLFPWLAGYRFNNVDHQICDCWKAGAEPPVAKTRVTSPIPALIVTGDIDPWCPPYYARSIKKGMPKAQVLIRRNNGHGPGFMADGIDYLDAFLKDPNRKLVAGSANVKIE